jgi:hypothetical protein
VGQRTDAAPSRHTEEATQRRRPQSLLSGPTARLHELGRGAFHTAVGPRTSPSHLHTQRCNEIGRQRIQMSVWRAVDGHDRDGPPDPERAGRPARCHHHQACGPGGPSEGES